MAPARVTSWFYDQGDLRRRRSAVMPTSAAPISASDAGSGTAAWAAGFTFRMSNAHKP